MPVQQPRIVVVGSTNVDLVTLTDHFPRPGETILGREFHLLFGGKGANQAVAASLCGARTHLLGKVGEDLFGAAAVQNLEAFGVDTAHVGRIPGVSSGVAPIFVDSSGENRIIVVKGANDHLRPEDVERASKILERADLIILQFEIPLDTVYYTIEFARSRQIRCLLNPAPGLPADLDLVCGVDYLVPNETEAETLTGLSVGSLEDAHRCAEALIASGTRCLLLTLGAAGVLVSDSTGREVIPGFEVPVKDTTGAGDAFIGCFATFLAGGLSEKEAARRACLYAALSTTRLGTQVSFPDRTTFEAEWSRRTNEPVWTDPD